MTNPMADSGTVQSFVMDEGLSTGICIQTAEICMEYEDEEEMDVTQIETQQVRGCCYCVTDAGSLSVCMALRRALVVREIFTAAKSARRRHGL